jgi:hypothetical protein
MGTKGMPMRADSSQQGLRRVIKMAFSYLFILIGAAVHTTSAWASFQETYDQLFPPDKRIYFDADYEAKCLLNRIKPGMDASAIVTIKQVCRRMSIPKRCRDQKDVSGPDCFAKCQEANVYQRNLGDCSMG